MDQTVSTFYDKNPDQAYGDTYDYQHGFRLDAMVEQFKLKGVKNQKVADVGGGLGFLGKRLDYSNDYWVFDGAKIAPDKRLYKGTWVHVDLQRDDFGKQYWPETVNTYTGTPMQPTPTFDLTFCLETLEHLSDPYHCLVQMKRMTEPGGEIIISIPTDTVTHNTPYPSLIYPRQNWEVFLAQMALPILEHWTYQPKPNQGWPAEHYRTCNADWTHARMFYPKTEPQFRGKTPLEYTNL